MTNNIAAVLASANNQLIAVSDSAFLDAEILLCHVLNKPRSHLRAWPEKILLPHQLEKFQQLLDCRLQGKPIAYITGHREFWSRDFKVTPDVLIPRPDTELLIELSLNQLKNKRHAHIIDLGTGSGNIAITLAAELPTSKIIATDSSEQALEIAKHNAQMHQISNIQFIQSSWFNKIKPQTKFDLIVSNPPYIAPNDPHLSQGDVRFEPDSALTAEEQGLKDIKTLCKEAHNYLNLGGTLLIEHGFEQQLAVQNIFKHYKYHNITTHQDLSGNPRVTTGQ